MVMGSNPSTFTFGFLFIFDPLFTTIGISVVVKSGASYHDRNSNSGDFDQLDDMVISYYKDLFKLNKNNIELS